MKKIEYRWRIWKDADKPEDREPTDITYEDWNDAALECYARNKHDEGRIHWCRIIEPV